MIVVSVIAIFKYDVKPGRFNDFMAKLKAAADPKFNSSSMPKSIRLFRSGEAGPGPEALTLLIEYDDMAACQSRTAFENANADWKKLFDPTPDSSETLRSRELLTELG
jgi:hypothetical protein